MSMNRFLRLTAAVCALFAAAFWPPSPSLAGEGEASRGQAVFERGEEAFRANNVGVAQLEQYNYSDAAQSFRRALEIDPRLVIAQINLAIALFNQQDLESARRAAETAAAAAPERPQPLYLLGLIARSETRQDDAVGYFRKVLDKDPSDVGALVNLGQILLASRRYDEAAVLFRRAYEAEPYNSTALYNLATVLLRTDKRDEGRQLMARFQELRASGAATSIGQNYLEQGRYAEALTPTGAEPELIEKTPPAVVFREASVGLPAAPAKGAAAAQTAALFDADGDGDLDLALASPAAMLRNDGGRFVEATAAAGDFARLAKGAACLVAGDFDNDLAPDLFVARAGGYSLYRNLGKGRFADATAPAKLPAGPAQAARACAFVDVDHDGDLDIFTGASGGAGNRLFRNNGDATFLESTNEAKIAGASGAEAVAVIPTDYDNRRDVDLLVLPAEGRPALFRNLRDATFRDVAGEVGLDRTGAWTSGAAGDFNKDGFVDFFFGRREGRGLLAVSDGRGKFVVTDAPNGLEAVTAAQFLDHDNDGLLDLVALGARGAVVARNLGAGGWSAARGAAAGKTLDDAGTTQFHSADTDGDGDLDLIVADRRGALRFWRNEGGSRNRSFTARLQGRASNRTAAGAKIDLRAGSLSQKLETYAASPAPAPSEIHFGLGRRAKPDAVRIIWTSGVVQAEVEFGAAEGDPVAARYRKIEELDRKPSSCPYLYAWNGEKFEFVTDFLGGGEMGNWKAPGAYHHPDSDEYVRITSEQLQPKDGRYEIRVTNELEEVLFLDALRLVAVEHDAGTSVYPNEGLGIPTAGRKIVYATRGEKAPLAARDRTGRDVLPQIASLDRRFYDSFRSAGIRGYAETHALTLELDDRRGYRGRTLLLLTGWTDYAFSSDNLAASQSGKALFLPKLQVKNARGEWQTVIESIGISVGRPQTVVVDLTGKFLTEGREVRIVTNFKTYWDRIAVDTSGEKGDPKTIELGAPQAVLRERGFSREIRFGEMIAADYDTVLNDPRWKYFAGTFTRTGPVEPLLKEIDDVFVIAKTGDELVLSFEALPAPPAGRAYTFLLYADGYSKEMDINSGSPDAVLPLPFKGMSGYPYDARRERYPWTEEKRKLYDEYTTRRVRGAFPRVEAALIK